MITRTTRDGGTLRLLDTPALTRCARCCDPTPIGVSYTAPGAPVHGIGGEPGPTLDTALCAGCIAEALALLFGRAHVQAGGALEDLAYPVSDPRRYPGGHPVTPLPAIDPDAPAVERFRCPQCARIDPHTHEPDGKGYGGACCGAAHVGKPRCRFCPES